MSMKLYHRTSAQAAAAILCSGFEDRSGTYLTTEEWSGVWLSDVPLDINQGALGDTLLIVELDLAEEQLRDYEWIEEGKPYREWLIPAALVNAKVRIRTANKTEF
jgi:hypothetical protein